MKQVREQSVLKGLDKVQIAQNTSNSAQLPTTAINKQTGRNGGIGR